MLKPAEFRRLFQSNRNGRGDSVCFSVSPLERLANGNTADTYERFIEHETLNPSTWSSWQYLEEVVVPATGRLIEKTMPKNWLDGTSGMDFYFSPKYDKNF